MSGRWNRFQPSLERLEKRDLLAAIAVWSAGTGQYGDRVHGCVAGISPAEAQSHFVKVQAFTDLWYTQPFVESEHGLSPQMTFATWTRGWSKLRAHLINRGTGTIVATSDEFSPGKPQGCLFNRSFVAATYVPIVQRPADPPGLQHWTGLLDQGVPRVVAAQGIWASAEHRGIQVDRFYATYLGRSADSVGRAFWVDRFLRGDTETTVGVGFLTSQEYAGRNPRVADYVRALYRDVLIRNPDPPGEAFWRERLEAGEPRQVVVRDFWASRENYGRFIDAYYATFLDRGADQTGKEFWVGSLQSGSQSLTSVAAAIIGSEESFAKALTGSSRGIFFAGRAWDVKAGEDLGPGPNNWGRASYVDSAGTLHLPLSNVNGRWQSSELIGPALGYGEYRFVVSGNLAGLDQRAVLGLFIYGDDNREIDFELSRFDGETPGTNAQFAVQPADRDSLFRFSTGTADTLTISMKWTQGRLEARCSAGRGVSQPPLASWTYTGNKLPAAAADMRVRMNLWLYRGRPPATGQQQEIKIESFEFIAD